MTAWLNGEVTVMPRIDPSDRGFTLGDGLFETIRAERGQAPYLERHWRRLRQGADLLDLPVPYDDDELSKGVEDLLAACGLADAALRLTLTRGPAPRGVLPPREVMPTLLITVAPLADPLPPVRLITAQTTRRNEHSPLSRIKSLNYLDSVLARQEAARRGADDAVLLNSQGHVAEASAANLLILLDGEIVTPPIADGALPGIRRALAMEHAAVAERSLTAADLVRAEDILLTSSLSLRSAASLDGRPLPQSGWIIRRFAQAL